MDLMALRYFQYVATYRNFSRAAEHFYIGQPALSRQIANLERALGVQLLVRDTRNVSLTDAGRQLYEQTDLLLRHHESVTQLMESARRGDVGQLRIATVANFGPAFAPYVRQFSADFPRVDTRIDDIPFDDLTTSILHGVYDLAITLDFGVPHHDVLVQKSIISDHFVVLIGKDYPYDGPDPMPLAELARLPLIAPRHVAPPVLSRLRAAGQSSVELVNNTHTALLRVDLGRGATLVPKLIVNSSFHDFRFRVVELDGVDTSFDLVATYRSDNQQQALANFLLTLGA